MDWLSTCQCGFQNLPKTASKLHKGDPLTLAVSGDSISFGLNASGLTGAPPLMPTYPSLVAEHLRHTTKSQITLVNRARQRVAY